MLDIPSAPVLDKHRLIGACARLPLGVDAARLADEVAALPSSVWGTRGGRVGVHGAAEALFLRGFAPAEGDNPVEDRPVLDRLPYVRHVIETLLRAPRLRCLLARLPAGATIPPHTDRPPYFAKTLRIHVPVETNPEVHMVAAGLCFRMRRGEVWALNNSTAHAVWNAHPTSSRTHLICDFLPSLELLELLANSERDLGEFRPEVNRQVEYRVSRALAGG